ncbi:uncharacterized protein LAESUDRAFT_655924 [Laetiporus sulphureus 93-53]|uniref:Uncharacterized protein n=1 Tax=Laetiporus sulphureus 93-53 TaxID=1314785 RepID=A0A165DPJ3_9APHY|nr:uncharacterized protein LAESUDRAFT_655924 [Laetiporus sulphureus 93-53]KZT05338.1 hypothetical protein LAESUDRAFT_655924 [Laetiporus sulphureus 93-53]
MSDSSSDGEDSSYRPSPSGSSRYIASAGMPPSSGCALLQALRGQVQAGQYPTTGGEYLEAIFTHREAVAAFPQGHHNCAVGFSDLAMELERRGMRPDREGDAEAVAAFRHEAWVIWEQSVVAGRP